MNKNKNGGIKSFFKSRKTRHGSVAIMIVAVVIAITIVINVISALLVDRFPSLKLDMTSNNAFALQEDTIDYVSHLSKDVKMMILSTKESMEQGGTYMAQAKTLLDKMVSGSDGKLKLEYIDLSQEPTFTTKYPNIDWTTSGSNYVMIVECGNDYKLLTIDDCFDYDQEYYYYSGEYQITGTKIEQAVVTAILNVTTEDKVIVDIINGNQVMDSSAIQKLLEDNAYNVNEVSLVTGDLDDDAQFAIMYAPAVDLDDSAVEKLSNWLNNGGEYGKNLIFVSTYNLGDTPNLDAFLDEWGMSIDKGFVFETSSDYLISNSTMFSFITDYNGYYTDGLKNNSIPVVSTEAHAIKINDENSAHALLLTSDKGGIYPIDADENWDYNDAMTGEPVAVAAEGTKTNTNEKSSNVMVFGSYLMFDSSIMQYNSFNNSAYLLSIFNTLSEKGDNSIVIESKSLTSSELGVTEVSTKDAVMIIFVIAVPLIVIIIGLVLWLRRRNK